MGDVIHKFIAVGAIVLMTVVLIAAVTKLNNQSQESMNIGSSKLSKLNSDLQDSDTGMYDGIVISGSEVLNVIKNYSEEKVSIKVVTKKSTTYYGYSVDAGNNLTTGATGSLKKAESITDNQYINPTGSFKGSILKDSNDVATCIVFTQE